MQGRGGEEPGVGRGLRVSRGGREEIRRTGVGGGEGLRLGVGGNALRWCASVARQKMGGAGGG